MGPQCGVRGQGSGIMAAANQGRDFKRVNAAMQNQNIQRQHRANPLCGRPMRACFSIA
jgi:hypothetical protein